MKTKSAVSSVQIVGLPGRRQQSEKTKPVRCQICDTPTIPGIDLGSQPVSDLILSHAQLNQPETFYPMQLHHCLACGLTQLGYVVDPKIVYKNFPFVSGTTETATKHLQSLPNRLVKMLRLDRRAFAVDIGSNDGTLLKGYLPFGVKFLGIDPSGDPVRIANEQGLKTMHAFFNVETADYVVSTCGKANAITACGVFGHIADLSGVMRGVKKLLAKKGVFATDSQYWLDTMEGVHYDNVFHQHLRYYSMRPLVALHRQYDMDVFDVERSDVYGGSIRVFSCHSGDYPISRRVEDLLALEEQRKLYRPETPKLFAQKVEQRRWKLFDSVYRLRSRGKKVIGLGAPAKASTICNYCGLGRHFLEYITEINSLRIGKFLPGVHIPIIDEEYMFEDPRPADAGILFAWNYYDEIVPKLRKKGFKGRILLP